MHLHEVLKIEISIFSISCTVIRPRLNSAHIGVACPLFFYTPLVIPGAHKEKERLTTGITSRKWL